MQARAIAMARCDLPVPVPPISTALRCSARKAPLARSRTKERRRVAAPVPPKFLPTTGVGSASKLHTFRLYPLLHYSQQVGPVGGGWFRVIIWHDPVSQHLLSMRFAAGAPARETGNPCARKVLKIDHIAMVGVGWTVVNLLAADVGE